MINTGLKETKLTVDGITKTIAYNIPDNSQLVVIAVHGMMEHSKRYNTLAEPFEEAGLGYLAFDLPGHGEEAKKSGAIGIWPDEGFEFCVKFIIEVIKYIEIKYNRNAILLGHSMGSFLTMKVIGRHGDMIKGCILSGTNDKDSPIFLNTGILVSKIISFFKGSDHKSTLLYNMAFGSFNNKFKPHRTKYDWLSRNNIEVDKYIADDLCGFTVSAKLFSELAKLMLEIFKEENISSIPKKLPVYLLSGSKDPVGNFGKGPVMLSQRLEENGLQNVKYKIYENGRHESLNEINRDEVVGNIIEFCKEIG